MSNHPFAPPAFGPARGRGAFNSAFQPYPLPRGRGRLGEWLAPRGRGRDAGHAPRDLAAPRDPAIANLSSPPAPSQQRQIRINDIVFELDAKGSKLARITPQGEGAETPTEHQIANVKFYRTKNGNLYRSDRYLEMLHKKQAKPKKFAELCPKFNNTGQCSRDCKFTHDINKVAVCKQFLMKGSCPAGSACALSHDLTAKRTPACIHFVRGSCTKPDCRYPHVKVNLDAQVCSPFAKLGYCEEGADCPNQHSFECPDYANTGRCSNRKCRLQHIDRTGQLRRIAGVQNEPAPLAKSPLSSAESEKDDVEVGMDLDSDDVQDGEMIRPSSVDEQSKVGNSAFSQQDDYVRFSDM